MFRFIARRMPRFGLPTLMALMLLVVSIGGAVRIGFGPDYEAAEALRAVENEGLGYRADRPFSGKTDAAALSADAWNPFRRLAHWLMRHEDRVVGVGVYGWPSAETRETLFDVPHLYEISMDPSGVEGPATGPGCVPLPEDVLKRSLPEFAHDAVVRPEPPPIPTGVPISDEERDEILREATKRLGGSPAYVGERFLCRMETTDLPRFVLTTASDGVSSWQMRYRRNGSKASALTELKTPEARACRVWDERWQTYWALRTPDNDLPTFIDPSIPGFWPSLYLLQSYGVDSDADEIFESAERLEDGTVLLRFRPREVWKRSLPAKPVMLVEGLAIVDPENDYVLTRYEAVEEERWPGMKTSICYTFEYARPDGHLVPVRSFSWTDLPARPIEHRMIPAGPRASVTRYAWDFDPELPRSLFEPPEGKGEFFAAAPSTGRFHWWYVTGAVAIGWLYFIVSRGILRRFRRAKPPKRLDEDSPIAIAESPEAS